MYIFASTVWVLFYLNSSTFSLTTTRWRTKLVSLDPKGIKPMTLTNPLVMSLILNYSTIPANINLFKANNRNPRKRCEIYSKLSIKTLLSLTLSWRRLISYRNQSIDLRSKSIDRFLYDIGRRHERVNTTFEHIPHHFLAFLILEYVFVCWD